ncbi:glutamine amidotransferase-related protein [Micavibrio aeruginosavorus]|uniref:glutamine amidotransferase-related protein n=1 Tax=Micavibrio aeruginosavorus TaxID=349221 RepID=UPI003F4AE9CF
MSTIRNATIFRHSMSDGAGTIADVLVDRGADITLIDTFDHDFSGLDPLKPDLLVVLGGACGIYQRDLYPFLNHEIDAVRARIDAGRPTLGICLGAQMIAAACGEDVYKGPRGEELGWHDLALTDAGKNSVARHFDHTATRVMQRHGDTFNLPKRATRLASTVKYENQIYAIENHVLAFQCHVEVTPRIMHSWSVGLAHRAASGDLDLNGLRADTAHWLPKMQAQTRLCLNEWLDQLS